MSILTIRNVETGKYRKVKTNEVGYINPRLGDHINPNEVIVKITDKEVKKVSRPYFETKVVKVKKEKDESVGSIIINQMCYPVFLDKNDRIYYESKQKKGNWVNGENLDKIKFPCFCSYSDGEGSKRKFGFLSMNNGYYYMADITTQEKVKDDIDRGHNYSLKDFIRENNIHIIKGKIIIFNDENTDEKYDIDIEEE